MGPAVRRPGPARRPCRQHGTRRAHPRAGGGADRERLRVARDRADQAHRPGRRDEYHHLRRRRPRPQHLGAGRRGTRGRPPQRAPREPHRRTPGRDPRRDPRRRRRLRPRQAGGRRRQPRDDDRPDPRGRHRVGRPGWDVQHLAGEERSRRGQGGPADRARQAARGARHAGVGRDGRAGRVVATRRSHRLGR